MADGQDKWSPGEWRAVRHGGKWEIISDAHGLIGIVSAPCSGERLCGDEAASIVIAQLMAAAPEMAEALQELRRNMRKGVTGAESRATWAKVNALLSRIEGAADA